MDDRTGKMKELFEYPNSNRDIPECICICIIRNQIINWCENILMSRRSHILWQKLLWELFKWHICLGLCFTLVIKLKVNYKHIFKLCKGFIFFIDLNCFERTPVNGSDFCSFYSRSYWESLDSRQIPNIIKASITLIWPFIRNYTLKQTNRKWEI